MLNRAVALERVGGDEQLLQEVALLFLDDYPKVLEDIHTAIQAKNPQALERAAHTLKGSVANFGAEDVVEAAFVLESMGRSGDLAKAMECYLRLDTLLKRLRPDLVALSQEVVESS